MMSFHFSCHAIKSVHFYVGKVRLPNQDNRVDVLTLHTWIRPVEPLQVYFCQEMNCHSNNWLSFPMKYLFLLRCCHPNWLQGLFSILSKLTLWQVTHQKYYTWVQEYHNLTSWWNYLGRVQCWRKASDLFAVHHHGSKLHP